MDSNYLSGLLGQSTTGYIAPQTGATGLGTYSQYYVQNPFGTGNTVSYYPYYIKDQYFLTVRQIENGWIVTKDGKEYVMTEPKDILEFFGPENIIKSNN